VIEEKQHMFQKRLFRPWSFATSYHYQTLPTLD
jgi:hypothetical protein